MKRIKLYYQIHKNDLESIFIAVGPVDVRILNAREPLSSGQRYDVRCRSIGARPHPKVIMI